MSILIKGMEMPKDCMSCQFGVDGQCVAMNPIRTRNWSAKETTNYCPLVPVPPHGELIERKAISLTDFEIVMCDGDYKEGMKMLLEKTEFAPTIIPAEEET